MAINLASISRQPTLAPPRIVLFGPHGIGKTTFGAQAPSPIILPFEDGIAKLDVPHFPLLRSFGEAMEAIAALYSEAHEYATVVVDSLDWLEPLVWAETCSRHKFETIESPGFGKGFLFALDIWREFFAGLVALREQKGMCVILLAHQEIKAFNDPNTEPYDRYQLKLQARAAALAEEWADCVLFANFRTYTAKSNAGFNKTVTRGVGSGERVLYTEERPGFRAKNRYALPPEMPFSWAHFSQALAGEQAAPAATAA